MSCFEVFSVTPVEADTGVPGYRVVEVRELVANCRSLESAAVLATRHADETNCGDGDYRVQDVAGREVASVMVRDGSPSVVPTTGGRMPAEQLDDLKAPCRRCSQRAVLVACETCDARWCARCFVSYRCCPPSASPQEE